MTRADPSLTTGDTVKAADNPSVTDVAVPQRVGRFEVREVLGAGAFGRVYRAWDPQLGRDVAVKVPLPDTLRTPADRERFLGEARAAAGLRHPNVCQIHEVGQDGDTPYIVMACVAGRSLDNLLASRAAPMPPREAAFVVRKLALALEAAHSRGVVHRDLKPANILCDQTRKEMLITDFGLARCLHADEARRTQSGVILGTPAYMAPEQARGDPRAVGPRSDVYSLGVILYELVTGRRPFNGAVGEVIGQVLHVEPEPPSKHRPELDAALQSICLKAMAKDVERRHGSMKALADDLNGYLQATAPPPRAVQRAGVPAWLWLAGASALGGLGALVLLGIIFFARTDTRFEAKFRNIHVPQLPAKRGDADPERAGAELFLDLGAELRLGESGEPIRTKADLPPGPVRVSAVWVFDKDLTDAHVRALATFPSLQSMVSHRGKLPGGIGAAIAGCQTLDEIQLADAGLTDSDLAPLSGLPRVTRVNLCNNPIGPGAIDMLCRWKHLAGVNLNGTRIGDAEVRRLAAALPLTHLHVGKTAVSDVGLKDLHPLRGLRTVSVAGCKNVTAAGIAELEKAVPGCDVWRK